MRRSTIHQNWVWGLLLVAMASFVPPAFAKDRWDSGLKEEWEQYQETPEAKAYDEAYEQWQAKLAEALRSHEQPIIRVFGSLMVTGRDFEAKYSVERQEIRRRALQDGWNDPRILLIVYTHDCIRNHRAEWCDAVEVREQFRRADHNNAVGVLLPLLFPGEYIDTYSLTPELETTLLEAAGQDYFFLYHGAGAYDAYLIVKDFSETHPLPKLPAQAADLLERSEYGWDEMMFFRPTMAVSSASGHVTHVGWLHTLCKEARELQRQAVFDACLRITRLMQSHPRSEISAGIGHGAELRLLYPDHQRANDEQNQSASWRSQLRTLVEECKRPPLIASNRYGLMPAGYWPQYLKDLQEVGESMALERAAQREYALNPEEFTMNPGDCEGIYDLDEETQKKMAIEGEIRRLDKVLETMGEEP